MSIQNDIRELNYLNIEIKRLTKVARNLREQKKEVEKRITDFLDSKEQRGVKYNNVAIIAEDKSKSVYKSQKEKMSDGISVLRNHGIDNPEDVLSELIKEMKGDVKYEKKLKITKLKQQK